MPLSQYGYCVAGATCTANRTRDAIHLRDKVSPCHTNASPTVMTSTRLDVLVVEDDPAALEFTLRALRQVDPAITTQVAVTGNEAIEYLTSRGSFAGQGPPPRPRLILLDLNVPNLNGLEILQFLREDACCPETPIVLFTSSENPKDIKAAYDNCVDAYVVKPDSAAAYASTIGRIASFWLHPKSVSGTNAGELGVRAS
jgi:two-component system response regulator